MIPPPEANTGASLPLTVGGSGSGGPLPHRVSSSQLRPSTPLPPLFGSTTTTLDLAWPLYDVMWVVKEKGPEVRPEEGLS